VLVGQLEARDVAVGENFRFGWGAAAAARSAGHRAHSPWAAGARVAHALGWRRSGSAASASRAPWRQYKSRKPTLLAWSAPTASSGPVVRGGAGAGLAWAQTANLRWNGSQIPAADGVYAAWARLVWPQRLVRNVMATVMNLAPTHRGPPLGLFGRGGGSLLSELDLEARELEG